MKSKAETLADALSKYINSERYSMSETLSLNGTGVNANKLNKVSPAKAKIHQPTHEENYDFMKDIK